MWRTMTTNLIEHQRIQTTIAKAKSVKHWAERMITLGKRGPKDQHARNQVLAFVRTNSAVQKIFNELAPRFANRNGGYTRIIACGRRYGDNAPMAFIEYVDNDKPIQLTSLRVIKKKKSKTLQELLDSASINSTPKHSTETQTSINDLD